MKSYAGESADKSRLLMAASKRCAICSGKSVTVDCPNVNVKTFAVRASNRLLQSLTDNQGQIVSVAQASRNIQVHAP